MALYINDEQISVEAAAKKLGIQDERLKRIFKKPNFRLDKSRQVKKNTIIHGANFASKPTYGVKTSFWFKDPSDGLRKRLRYAENQIPRVEGNVMRYEYEPGRLNIEAAASFPNAPDKAFFMFANPGNPSSPLYTKGGQKKFAYVDSVEEAKQASEDMSAIQKAFLHASQSSIEELVIVAKGIGLLRSDDYEPDELRVKMQQFALNPSTSKQYVKGMDDELTRIEGRIRNMVDKGIFKIKKSGSARQWIWGAGAKEGAPVGDPIYNVSEDALNRLIVYLKANLDKYVWDIKDSDNTIHANRKAQEVLQAMKEAEPEVTEVPSHLAAVNAPVMGLKYALSSFNDYKEYVADKGYSRHNAKVAEFKAAVEDNLVDHHNVDEYLKNLWSN